VLHGDYVGHPYGLSAYEWLERYKCDEIAIAPTLLDKGGSHLTESYSVGLEREVQMNVSQESFFLAAMDYVRTLHSTQCEPIERAAKILARSISCNGVVQVFGVGHSEALAMEIASRAV
jgi:hypothetical protein